MKNYSFSNRVVLRTPLKAVETNITWDKIQQAFKDTLCREALFVASPNLYQLLERYEADANALAEAEINSLKVSLYKYYARFSNRCTPFGLFAYVSTVELAKESAINMEASSIRKATRFDTFFLANLLQFINKEPEIRKQLKYTVNSSLYTLSDKYRYVEYYFKKEIRLHKISGVDRNVYLDKIINLAAQGLSMSELCVAIVDEQVSEEQANAYLHTLIDNQFLVSELEINLTGEDYLKVLIDTFSEKRFDTYEGQQILELLKSIQSKLNTIEANNGNVDNYLELFEFVNKQFDQVNLSKLYQVDGFRQIPDGTLSFKLLKQLRSAIQMLNRLSPDQKVSNLERFKNAFKERYEEYEIPLTQALDPDIGIGYGKELGAKTPLIENLSIANARRDMKIGWSKQQAMLFKKILKIYQEGGTEITLTEEDVKPFEENEAAYFDTFSVFFNAFNEGDKEKIHLKTVWGPTATSLIGRFAYLDDSVYNLSEELAAKEENINKDKIVAEILHLPQARTANVLYRKNKRAYEIPYLAKASVEDAQQLSINDLMVSVKSGRVMLRSKSLNKEVIPRLSNAHNYVADPLPIYHFLCDLQLQGSMHIGFSWSELQYYYPFLPRVSFKDVILSRATWMLQYDEMQALLKHENSDSALLAFVEKRQLPKIVSLAKGDNEVLINFENPLSRQVFLSMIKNKPMVELKEFLFQENSVTGAYANEFIASAYKSKVEENFNYNKLIGDYKNDKVANTHTIGDDWLYYKFYCGDKIAEKVLQEGLLPAVQALNEQKLIDKWFFIRYMDKNGFHIRFRIKLKDKNLFSQCIQNIKTHIAPLEAEGIIWKTQIDTYLRETERYGYHSIEDTESFFHHDSECSLRFVNMIEGEAGEKIRWLFCLLSMDRLLADFGFELKDKVNVLNMMKTSFGKEFNRKGHLNKQINELYKTEETSIAQFLDQTKTHPMYQPLWQILAERSAKNKALVKRLKTLNAQKKLPLPLLLGVLPSYIHMICNRIFLNKQRMHEMVVYDFLYKYYSKQLHMRKKQNNLKMPLAKSA